MSTQQRGQSQSRGVPQHFSDHESARKYARLPLYTPSNLPSGIRPAGGAALGYEWGDVAVVTLDFESYNAQFGTWELGLVSLWAQTQFPRPFPFWFDPAATPDSPGWPEKVDFLPAPGLQVASGFDGDKRLGYTFHWIQRGVLYWLKVENHASLDNAQALATSLVTMS